MNPNIYFISFLIGLGFTATVLHLIRSRRLREQYAILWLVLGVFMMGLSLFPGLLDGFSAMIRVSYAPSLLYLLAFVAVLFLLLHLSIAVSSLTSRNILLTQSLALLEHRINGLVRSQEAAHTEAKIRVPQGVRE
ncbi:DUF2304 domain-containing protein [Cohnella silvisoli]|uniref:DUF2304 domain-containing protein n=1 Tax=Cohnella silvisoli TaxID=2873699 RepID=A0ABV1KUU1_9BACL|nr:DUF2304 domain-containing protein [Cohnella silvisoli]MCD9022987.1 DUF2304 domain-containing protein [Cohnella silvisoli]